VERSRPLFRFAELFSGLLIWGAQFTLVYMVTSVACGRGLGRATVASLPAVPAAIVAVTGLALAATGALLGREIAEARRGADARPTDRFLNTTAIALNGVSVLAIAYNALPALIVPLCP